MSAAAPPPPCCICKQPARPAGLFCQPCWTALREDPQSIREHAASIVPALDYWKPEMVRALRRAEQKVERLRAALRNIALLSERLDPHEDTSE